LKRCATGYLKRYAASARVFAAGNVFAVCTSGATVSSMDSSAFRDRVPSAVLALALQAAFIFAFLHALPLMAPPRQLEHELTFFLPRLAPQPAPVQTGPALRTPALPVFTPPPLFSLPAPAAPPTSAPPAALQNFGQSLFGCAPENYSSLTPQQKAGCPRPGEGLAIQEPSWNTPGRAKDEATYQEQFRRKHLPMPDCPASGSWMDCTLALGQIEGAREKQTDKELAYQKEKALRPPPPPLPPNIAAYRP
jgi:hypothetical protein